MVAVLEALNGGGGGGGGGGGSKRGVCVATQHVCLFYAVAL